MTEQIAVPLTKIAEVRCVSKFLVISTPHENYTFETETEVDAANAFEAIVDVLEKRCELR